MTTRVTPIALEEHGQSLQGCLERVLGGLSKADAITFFEAQHIQGRHDEIEVACATYGYHALTLCLVVGRILKDFDNPRDISVVQHLRIEGDVKQHQHHVLEVSYNNLPTNEQKLLSTIACFRSPVEYKTLETIVENKDVLDTNLHDLVDRGLLHFDQQNKKFDLHPIVRHYAYDRLTTPERIKTHERLVNYFEAVPKPAKVQTLEDLAPVIELYHHMVRAGNLDEARKLYYDRLQNAIYFQFGAYQLEIELLRALFLDGEDKPPRLKDESDQAWTLNQLSASYALSGQSRHAALLLEINLVIRERQGNKKSIAIVRGNMATQQLVIGALERRGAQPAPPN